jgi:hypothetical protein
VKKIATRIALAMTVAGALGAGTFAFAANPSTPVQPEPQKPVELAACVPNPNVICPQVYDPVICNDGVIYSNSCYAGAACAKGCKPYRNEV